MNTYTANAYAKINLYLDVMEKTDNGFHNIKSVMQSISLSDVITLKVSKNKENRITVFCDSNEVPEGSDNIVAKAAAAFFRACGIKDFDVCFEIKKNIPVAAGLAGGSTDAAETLKLLNHAYKTELSVDELCRIGAEVGSDVPFCITGGTALAEGRGEKLKKIESNLDLSLVVTKGGEGISTPIAYRMIDEKFGNALSDDFGNINNVITALKTGDLNLLCDNLYNTFEDVVLPYHSKAKTIKEYMMLNGASASLLSGSGPTVFGIFNDEEAARAVNEYFISKGYSSSLCHTVL